MLTMRPQPASSMSGNTAWIMWKTPLRLTSITPLPVLELDVGEPLEPIEAGGVDQNGDRTELIADGRERSVDLRTVGHVGGERELRFGRIEVDGGDVVAVFAEPLGDGQADAGTAPGDDSGLHVQAPSADHLATKNRPSIMRTVLSNCGLPQGAGNYSRPAKMLRTLPAALIESMPVSFLPLVEFS